MHISGSTYKDLAFTEASPLFSERLLLCKEKAIAYLAAEVSRKGSWQCFDTLAGRSDEWVTAYIGCCLASMKHHKARELAEKAHRFLSRSRYFSSGWGFNKIVPCDADSTTWAIHLNELLQKQTASRGKYYRAQKMLLKHTDLSGGISTYRKEGPIRIFTRLKKNISFDGWCGLHTCVTAAVANLKASQFSLALNYLRKVQTPNGSWVAYWWTDREYVTGLAVAALYRNDPSDITIQKALNWAFGKMEGRDFVSTFLFPDGSCFATSWMLYMLSFSGNWDKLIKIVEWLMLQQKPDGSWNASATLRIPPPFCIDPESYPSWSTYGKGGGSIVMDKNSVFTTASVLLALEHISTNCIKE